jgi:hypothetical protein
MDKIPQGMVFVGRDLEFFCISSIDISALQAFFMHRITINLYRFSVKRMVHRTIVSEYQGIFSLQRRSKGNSRGPKNFSPKEYNPPTPEAIIQRGNLRGEAILSLH